MATPDPWRPASWSSTTRTRRPSTSPNGRWTGSTTTSRARRTRTPGRCSPIFRDWVPYTGPATPAYADFSSFRPGTPTTYHLSGRDLVTSPEDVAAGKQQFLTPVAGIPTSSDPLDVLGSALPLPEVDLPGTAATWTTEALTENVDVVGSPTLDLRVTAPSAAGTQLLDVGKLVLFVKVQDVDPDGKASVVRDLVAPVRVPDAGQPFTVTLPAIVHRFAEGHSIRLVVAGGSTNYRGGLVPAQVAIPTGSSDQALTLPVVP
ncbi:CocE/NonD family hydrolase C-terminal non-catalytic domain-containing protein [Aeromicrobium sp. CTD01-1L150]|uniref:CocE/NonD family hydrolase C-terminal non-catalytic domain-containing protein n=1 Tax=Aeromicrobium sp. CTD01-1L150 TaxID=3341830 RepID=UPI0035C02472